MQKMNFKGGTSSNSIDILGRRKLVFKYFSLGLSPKESHTRIVGLYPCSIDTVRRDIRRMGGWLPGLLSLNKGDMDKSLTRIIGLFQLSQDRLIQLMFSADNDNARVGAAKGLAVMAAKEAEVRMNTGLLPRMAFRMEGFYHIKPDLEGLDEQAIGAIVDNFMNDEARRLRRADMVEPNRPLGTTAPEVEEVGTPGSNPSRSVGVSSGASSDPGCSICRLFNRSCTGPTFSDLDENGNCIHIQPWSEEDRRKRGLSV